MSKSEERGALVNDHFNTKLLFLAKLAARRKGQSLVDFIEDALRKALSPTAMQEDEPNVIEPIGPRSVQEMPLWMEGLWVDIGKPSQNAAARLFMVGTTDVNLLAPKQRALFHHIFTELVKEGKKVTLKNFVGFIEVSESGE